MDTKFCSACYARIRSDARFCTSCGENQYEDISLGPRLMILTKDQNSVVFPLSEGKSTIGRHIKNAIIVEDEHVSTFHAAISVKDDNVFIEDLNSQNGVYVNGKKISGHVKLNSGTLIKIGSTILKFMLEQEYMDEVN